MDKNKEKQEVYWSIPKILLIITYLFLLWHIREVWGAVVTLNRLLLPFVYGFGIAYLLNPLVELLSNKLIKRESITKRQYYCAIFLTYLIVSSTVLVFMFLVVPQVIISLESILQGVPTSTAGVEAWVTELYAKLRVDDELKIYLVNQTMGVITGLIKGVNEYIPQILGATKVVTTMFMNVLLGCIISIYMLSHRDTFKAQAKKILKAFTSEAREGKILSFCQRIHQTTSRFLVAKIIDSLIIGILCYIGLLVLGIDNAVLIGVIIGVTNVIPYFGPFIGAVPATVLIMCSSMHDVIPFIVFILVLQQFDGNILGPKLLGESTGLSSFWVIFAVIMMTGLLGILGMLLGVPIFAILYMWMRERINLALEKKGLPTETEEYK